MKDDLGPYERWMVKTNLRYIRTTGMSSAIVARLRANGYERVAAAVEQALKEKK